MPRTQEHPGFDRWLQGYTSYLRTTRGLEGMDALREAVRFWHDQERLGEQHRAQQESQP